MSNTHSKYPYLGFGLGLRSEYYQTILEQPADVDWFEIISENYMVAGGKPLNYLDKIRERYPVVMHGVSLSIGSTDPLDREYLQRLKALADRINPAWISDHLCWTIHGGHNVHDLLPLPYTETAMQHVAERIMQVQDILGRRMLMENVSSYVTYTDSEMSEWEFYSGVVEKADCLMLLDINNIHVSAVNHNFDPLDYINAVPTDRVQQIHLAGHTDYGDFIIDTHDHPVIDRVWELYDYAIQRLGQVSTMIERDDNFPPFEELMAELQHARQIVDTRHKANTCTA